MATKSFSTSLILAVTLLGCGTDPKLDSPSGLPEETDEFESEDQSGMDNGVDEFGLTFETFKAKPSEPYQVDVIFLVDTSTSMFPYANKIKQGIPKFAAALEKFVQFEHQVFVVGTGFDDIDGTRIDKIPNYVGSTNALSEAQKVIKKEAIGQKFSSRTNAVKELVVITNDDSDVPSSNFISWIKQNGDSAKNVRVSGIVGTVPSLIFPCLVEKPGNNYKALAAAAETKGVIGDLCQSDWTGIFNDLALQIGERKVPPSSKYALERTPSDITSMEVYVNDRKLENKEWIYLSDSNAVTVFLNSSVEDQVKVKFKP